MGLIKRAAIAAIGMVLTLAYWSLRGSGPDTTQRLTTVPDVVWESGPSVTIEASCSHPAKLHLSFGRRPPDAKEEYPSDQTMEVDVLLTPGDHRYEIKVPSGVHGYVELGIDKPPVGAKASVRVRAGERVAAEDDAQLDQPLEQGTAFFAQVHMSDYAAGTID